MREIKYRGKSLHGGWIYGFYVFSSVFSNTNGYCKHLIVQKDGEYKEIELKTLGQFTGLLDKNGKEIYEGDIVKINGYSSSFNKKINDTIEIDDIRNVFLPFNIENCQNSGIDTEVIGNIYENSELLETKY